VIASAPSKPNRKKRKPAEPSGKRRNPRYLPGLRMEKTRISQALFLVLRLHFSRIFSGERLYFRSHQDRPIQTSILHRFCHMSGRY